jgi:hypothetical protein
VVQCDNATEPYARRQQPGHRHVVAAPGRVEQLLRQRVVRGLDVGVSVIKCCYSSERAQ